MTTQQQEIINRVLDLVKDINNNFKEALLYDLSQLISLLGKEQLINIKDLIWLIDNN